jgi:hypothetical protein
MPVCDDEEDILEIKKKHQYKNHKTVPNHQKIT